MKDGEFLLSVFCRRYELDESLVARNAFGQAPVSIAILSGRILLTGRSHEYA